MVLKRPDATWMMQHGKLLAAVYTCTYNNKYRTVRHASNGGREAREHPPGQSNHGLWRKLKILMLLERRHRVRELWETYLIYVRIRIIQYIGRYLVTVCTIMYACTFAYVRLKLRWLVNPIM